MLFGTFMNPMVADKTRTTISKHASYSPLGKR
jgi:hypothetical protein